MRHLLQGGPEFNSVLTFFWLALCLLVLAFYQNKGDAGFQARYGCDVVVKQQQQNFIKKNVFFTLYIKDFRESNGF